MGIENKVIQAIVAGEFSFYGHSGKTFLLVRRDGVTLDDINQLRNFCASKEKELKSLRGRLTKTK